jgi:hypothetical protein
VPISISADRSQPSEAKFGALNDHLINDGHSLALVVKADVAASPAATLPERLAQCPQKREHGEDAPWSSEAACRSRRVKMLCTCASTVLGLRNSRSPMAWLERAVGHEAEHLALTLREFLDGVAVCRLPTSWATTSE